MTTWCDQRFAVDGVQLAWGERGQGRPFVLVHGWTGSAHDFTLHVDALSTDRRVLAYDHRGHGDSTNTGDPSTYNIARLVADLEAWAETVVGEPFDLLGHSMGGRVVLEFALARPDLVRSLILMDTTAWRMDIGVPTLERWLTNVADADLHAFLQVPGTDPEAMVIATTVPAAWAADNAVSKHGIDPVAARQLGLEIFTVEPHIAERLGEITCPVTVLAGEHDHPFIDHAAPMAAAVADGRLVVIEGAWHSPQLTHPAVWLKTVREHLGRA
ncbi:unannotated protein [freshwater metagenome]|uniref:Unannotated protein n=1 Tax=freshwater metagenome TaxID=449393 RepID=A0A6J7FD25_9ZZZZ|nr:alpha/beta fold hydrolase [Actinomycetota bacterium]